MKNPFVSKAQDGFAILKEVFQKEGNVGWYYQTLEDGFQTEKEAKEALKKYQN